MSEHFLTDIEIKQFKCFTDFRASGFKRVNLIGGKNNIGKTALMEAIYIHAHATNVNTMIKAIYNIKYDRESLNILYGDCNLSTLEKVLNLLETTKKYITKSNLGIKEFEVIVGDGIKSYRVKNNNNELSINSRDFSLNFENLSNVRIIDTFGWCDSGIASAYESIQKYDHENELDKLVQEFDSSIKKFKVIGNKPQCKANDEYRDIVEFGDGLRHFISMVCGLYACENSYLFIDEIDNGIYYEHFDRLWEIVLTLSKETNCQVFATTHSKEMLESFARVAKKLDEQDVSFTTLFKNKNGEIKAITRDYEMILGSLEDGREVR